MNHRAKPFTPIKIELNFQRTKLARSRKNVKKLTKLSFARLNMNQIIQDRDNHFWHEVESVLKENDLGIKFISENISSFTMRRHTAQLFAYYELFDKVKFLPGSILEFGVFYGNGLFTWLNLLETFIPLDRGRKVFGFDDMKGYKRELKTLDVGGAKYIEDLRGDYELKKEIIERLVAAHNSDNLVPYDQRCIIYDGDVKKTFKDFRDQNQGVRVCLANIDLNLYEPTKYVLENIWDILVKGGIVILRGYGSKPWEGESLAVDEFFKEKDCRFETIIFNNTPGCFVVKD